jgi:tetratricopeptide (TPR) repeat protein
MHDDFAKKWDDTDAILAEMKKTDEGNTTLVSSPKAIAAFNAVGCSGGAADIAVGECMLEKGEDAEAEKFFAAMGDAGGAASSQGRGIALARLGRHDEAIVVLKAAIAAEPGLWRAQNALGVSLDYLGDRDAALAAFDAAAELNRGDGSALNNKGVALLKAGLDAEAISAFEEALRRDPALEAAEANLRLAYAMSGDYQAAVSGLSDADRAAALNNAGVAAAARGDKEEARRLFQRALDESPQFYAKAYANMNRLLR